MKLLLDMNLSPDLAPVIVMYGHDMVHWSQVGDHRATPIGTNEPTSVCTRSYQ